MSEYPNIEKLKSDISELEALLDSEDAEYLKSIDNASLITNASVLFVLTT